MYVAQDLFECVRNRVHRFRLSSAWLAAALLCFAGAASPASERQPLPYRFLLVISGQWNDPASYVIEGGSDFHIIAALLKTWGLPFDILRLDQQRLDAYHLLNREGHPRHGTIIWDAEATLPESTDLKLLEPLVREHGVSLVVLGDAVATAEISKLAGVRYISDYVSPHDLKADREHFITRELRERPGQLLPPGGYVAGHKVAVESATVLCSRGSQPFLTVRRFEGGGRVVWLGAHRAAGQMQRQVVRDLFKRSLVWAQGYALYAEYPRHVILFMDDMGTSEKTYLPYWNYPTLSEELIRTALIEPLKKRKAVLVQNVNTGFVDRKSRRVLNPWKQTGVVDELDSARTHDFASTKRGLDAGVREGVFEIQSHGWTHMLPDLDSPPGPWWDAPMDGVGSLSWYTEFVDRLRKAEIPAILQRTHMELSLDYIREDFGVQALFINPGGAGISRSYVNHTGRIAAQVGFGLGKIGGPCYLGRDLVVLLDPVVPSGGWAFDRKLTGADIPWTPDGPYFLTFHDRDVAMDPGSVARLLDQLGEGVCYMSAAEYCGYLHARVELARQASGQWALCVHYDDHYCRYFESHGSAWILHISDELRPRGMAEKRRIEIPKGLGRHVVAALPF